ncbi:MAG: aminoacyl-tRNA hydrolase [Ruminococcus sp.]|nr:aminoacyl-tRNA hydrolase [Ruminococcus sp.]
MKLIVGLGNPGLEYHNTRHNIGFMTIDNYLNHLKTKYNLSNVNWQTKFKAEYLNLNINNEKVFLVKPTTYMNLSGESIIEFVNYYKIDIKDILIIHDDLDLKFGTYRLKKDSSSGGHNGIKSIINNLGTNAFTRLKIGISSNKEIDTKDYVLGHFSSEESEKLNNLYPTFNNIIDEFLKDDINKLMNKYNRKS